MCELNLVKVPVCYSKVINYFFIINNHKNMQKQFFSK